MSENEEHPIGALSSSGLCVDVSGRRILNSADVTCPRGVLVGVLGANGAGKSTLLRALCGTMPAASGVVTAGGIPIQSMQAAERARRIALVPQQTECAWPVPCRMIVELGRLPHTGATGSGTGEDRGAIEDAMDVMGIRDLADRPATRISGGELKRVLIARALATRPDYLLLDEPTAALDPFHQLRLMEILRAQSRAGRGVVATLHDLTLAARYCDEVVVLHRGTVAASGTPRAALSPAVLLDCYGIDARLEWRGGTPFLHSRLPGGDSRPPM